MGNTFFFIKCRQFSIKFMKIKLQLKEVYNCEISLKQLKFKLSAKYVNFSQIYIALLETVKVCGTQWHWLHLS